MKINLIEERKPETIKTERILREEENCINEKDTVFDKNIYEKAQMLSELLDMDMSIDSIQRILKIDPDGMDRLLTQLSGLRFCNNQIVL